ncbi:MAG: TCP-1/cpn60 chaperonin family protein [Nanoarchaeota archaeon]|nr:TCP-1/cpn60 chaperonin family protein [Nanoarchaeota archaeon]MBU0977985.1 TCP-1/cpn60 chaperonin family protein [Nanoarchaeota archaeon]
MVDSSTGISSERVSRTIGREAQKNNILAAKIVADIVKTTLGPKGMDKMLVDSEGNITVTNDGVTILEEMEIEHPAAKMMVEIARTQEKEVGDGTTTAALLAGTLLEKAEGLLEKKVHPTLIVEGYRLASEKAEKILEDISINVDNRSVLNHIVMTAMTGKGAEGNKERLAQLVVEAVDQVADGNNVNLNDIKMEKVVGDSVRDSELVQGMVLQKSRVNKEMPPKVENARVLLVDFPLEIRSPEMETKISISTPEQLEAFIQAEEVHLKEMVDKITGTDANVVFCQKGIDDVAQYYLAKKGIFACRRVAKSDMEKLARATSGKVVSNLHDISGDQLGKAGEIEEVSKGGESFVYVRRCDNPKAVTLILKGGTQHLVEEIERAVKDGLGDVVAAVRSGKIVPGGGAVEMELARRLRHFARSIGGKMQLAVEEFANALESIPETLAENAGLDPIEILTELRRRHEAGAVRDGLNLFKNTIEDAYQAGIVEPVKVKQQAVSSAGEVAMMILRIDDVLISKGKGEEKKVREMID